jgi:hypothetical protein
MRHSVNTLASIIFLASLCAAEAADVPKLNVERMCRESAAADPTIDYGPKRCIDSEHEARDQLARQWKDFPAADRQECTAVATMGGSASYVELITCLEMNRDVREARAKAKIDSKPSSLSKQKAQ